MSNVDVIFIIGSSPLSVCCLHIRLLASGWDDTKISPSPDIDCILMSKRGEEGALRDTRDNAVMTAAAAGIIFPIMFSSLPIATFQFKM